MTPQLCSVSLGMETTGPHESISVILLWRDSDFREEEVGRAHYWLTELVRIIQSSLFSLVYQCTEFIVIIFIGCNNNAHK